MLMLATIAHQLSRNGRRMPRVYASRIGNVVSGAAALTCATIALASAAERFPIECALRDVQVLTQLEQAGEIAGPNADHVGKAFLTMLEARAVCAQQRVAEGLALYDGAFTASLASTVQK